MTEPSHNSRRWSNKSSRFLQFQIAPAASPSRHQTTVNGGGASPSPVSQQPPLSSPARNVKSSALGSPAAAIGRKSTSGGAGAGGGGGNILWPSSAVSSSPQTLADHLGSENRNNGLPWIREKQRSYRVAKKGENESERVAIQIQKENVAKENHHHRPSVIGASFRHSGKFGLLGNAKKPASPSFEPVRSSVHESSHRRRGSDYSADQIESRSSEFEPLISRRTGSNEVPSRYLNRVGSGLQQPGSPSQSPSPAIGSPNRKKKFDIKKAMRRVNSLPEGSGSGSGSASSPSRWALSPGRTGSPPMTVETKGRPMSFSTWKPPTSPTKHRGMDKLLSFGIEFFKSTKRISYASTSNSSSSSAISTSPSTAATNSSLVNDEKVHKLRMLHGRLLQWRYANAKAELAKEKMKKQAESDMMLAWSRIVRMHESIVQKKLQLQKGKLHMKLTTVLHSQLGGLETWRDMERKHGTALSSTQESLQAAVCKVPLINGARVDEELTSLAFRHATDLANSITSALSSFSCPANEAVELLSELAKVVAQEKLAIEEFDEIYRTVAKLQVEESNLKSAIIQMNPLQKQQQEEEVTQKLY